MHRTRTEHRLDEYQCCDVEYVVYAHTDPAGNWVIAIEAHDLDLDADGIVSAVYPLDTFAAETSLPAHSWNADAADAALRGIGFERVEPWELRSTSGLTAHTQVTRSTTRRAPLLAAS